MKLKFIICGVEQSGTTVLSDFFRQIPDCDAGFECGVLLSKSPRGFPELQPFAKNMLGGWKISLTELEEICQTDDFNTFYVRLAEVSRVLSQDCEWIFDKTPRYFLYLKQCIQRVDVPFVATFKDPKAIVYSDYKRQKPVDFEEWYKNYYPKKISYLDNVYNNYIFAKENLQGKVLLVSLESLCFNARPTLEKIFEHCGCEFRVEYLSLKALRYPHTREPYLTTRIPLEYLDAFDKATLKRIDTDFMSLDEWFYR